MTELIYQAYAIFVLIAVVILVLITIGGFLIAARAGWKARESRRRELRNEL